MLGIREMKNVVTNGVEEKSRGQVVTRINAAYSLLDNPHSPKIKSAAEEMLRTLGGSRRFRGFDMVINALVMVHADSQLLQHIQTVYEAVALSVNTSWMCVERDIRYLFTNIWDEGDRLALNRIACRTLKQKPPNGEFLDILAYGLRA